MSDVSGFRRPAAGVIDITGRDREAYLQGQCTNDVLRLAAGGVVPAAVLTPKGKLLFIFRVSRLPDRLRLLTDAGQASALLAHLRKYAIGQQVEFLDRSDALVRFDFYGETPASLPPAAEGTQLWPPEGEIRGSWLVPKASAGEVEAGLADGLARLTDEEAEIARIEAGRPLFGRDMDGTRMPDEVGMEEAISRTKGCYVGQEIVARLKTYGHVNKRFVGFSFLGDSLPPAGAVLVRPEEPEKEAGWVTSSARSARYGLIGLGYARREIAEGDILKFSEDASLSARVAGKSRR